jgi:hypothetical protein
MYSMEREVGERRVEVFLCICRNMKRVCNEKASNMNMFCCSF